MTASPNPSGCVSEVEERQALTNENRIDSVPSAQKLVSGLLLEAEIDADLKLIIERWQGLSEELRRAIVKMVR